MELVGAANLALRFVLELCALAATAYWGSTTGSGVTRWLLAIGAPAGGTLNYLWPDGTITGSGRPL